MVSVDLPRRSLSLAINVMLILAVAPPHHYGSHKLTEVFRCLVQRARKEKNSSPQSANRNEWEFLKEERVKNESSLFLGRS